MAAPLLRQITGASTDASASTTIAKAYGSAVLQHSTLLAFIDVDTTATVTGVSDSVNGAWASVTGSLGNDSSDAQSIEAYILKDSAAGTPTVTASFSASVGFRGLQILEITGADNSNPVNTQAGGAPAASTTPSINISPTVDNCYIAGGVAQSSNTTDLPGSQGSFTNRLQAGGGTQEPIGVNDFTQTSHATVAVAFSFANSDGTCISAVAIKAPAGTAAPILNKGLQSEGRAEFRVKDRLQFLREHGRKWAEFFGPAIFPLRNTTLVPAPPPPGKLVALGRRQGERLNQRKTASWGRVTTFQLPLRSTPPVTPKAQATYALGRRQGQRAQQRRIASWGRVTLWQRPIRSSPSVNPPPNIVSLLTRTRTERARIAQRQSEVQVVTQLLIVQPPNTPALPGAKGFATRRTRPRRLRHKTMTLATRLTLAPPPPTPVLVGVPRSMISTARSRQARRVHIRHNQSRVIAKRGLPVKPFVPPVTTTRRMWMGHRAHRMEIILPTPVDIA